MRTQPISIKSKYTLLNKIGAGSFGQIFVCQDKDGNKYAAKFEDNRTKYPQLKYEAKLYNIFSGAVNIGKLHWFGTQATNDIMVIDLFGKSIEALFRGPQRLTLKTVLMLADQMISSVEYIHKRSFIHRDIKPDNFVMGLGKNASQVYIIDFGLSKRYRDLSTYEHIPLVEGKNLTGTARYASINALKGLEQSRRDDMESLGYVFVYLLKGTLPWIGLSGDKLKTKFEMICDYKENIPLSRVCEGLPSEFAEYLRLVRHLDFTEEPEYSRYRQMFRDLFIRKGYIYDYKYDWSSTPTIGFRRERRFTQTGKAPRPPASRPFRGLSFREPSPQETKESIHPSFSRAGLSLKSNLNSMKVQVQMSAVNDLPKDSSDTFSSSTISTETTTSSSSSETSSESYSSSDLLAYFKKNNQEIETDSSTEKSEPMTKLQCNKADDKSKHAMSSKLVHSPVPKPTVIPIWSKKPNE
ncbi:CK1 family protein kinase [Histomonas meleagridis]|uniref:CK1 family protein kinase n=1 Tax=Histomonas meleagridis TaxID=135588 RepID=UPI003559BDFE|nr:CK1 family protein kinase [Histomonas meleagridis]KAH0804528.1 CK1 family protein kinase [Histomonas meleagridis]